MDVMKQAFREFIFSTNTDGSGKAASYVCALFRDNGFTEIANQWKDDAE